VNGIFNIYLYSNQSRNGSAFNLTMRKILY